MPIHDRWFRPLVIAGLAGMLLGALDPLEGSLVIAAGSVLVGLGTPRQHSAVATRVRIACLLMVAGVAALWIMSDVGGVGGSTGRSMWWLLLVAPYPVGWALGLIGAVQRLRELRRERAETPIG
ncbi:hypothetical protein [Gemmatimonas sp.]|jgi:hypothetical protein|uniref:hypothetical protein n=1 Tax=Gemmatimonas sp. TaxID=1962908 RepID=UPI0037BF0724